MHLILVSNRLATAKTFNVPLRLILGAVAALACLVVDFSFVLWRLSVPAKVVETVTVAITPGASVVKTAVDQRENISSMAVKLGEMQAELMRLDALGDRISNLSGLPAPKSDKPEPAKRRDGQGGPLVDPWQPMSADELQHEIDRLAEAVDESADGLTALESQLMERRIKSSLLPTLMPINAERMGSPFGRRIDPLAGVRAMHEGIDFGAPSGTPVSAAAGGVVDGASFHPEYGYLIELNHGNEFSSRYAHLSKLKVKPGQVVKRGQLIGLSGNTGRSTGPHLHFEVRFKGVAQNPGRFLNQNASLAEASVDSPTRAGKRISPAPRSPGVKRPSPPTEAQM